MSFLAEKLEASKTIMGDVSAVAAAQTQQNNTNPLCRFEQELFNALYKIPDDLSYGHKYKVEEIEVEVSVFSLFISSIVIKFN